jgi:hypothetical protein
MTDEPHINAQKVRGKPFQKGHAGKRPGTRNRATALAERLASKDIGGIVEKVVALAKEGDSAANTALLNRLWPAPRGRLCVFELPPIQTAADAEKAIGAVLQAVASGKLTVDEGDKLAATIGRMGEAVHMRLVEERLAALEAAQPQQINSYRRVA